METPNSPSKKPEKTPEHGKVEQPVDLRENLSEHHEQLSAISEKLRQHEALRDARKATAELAPISENAAKKLELAPESSSLPNQYYATTKKTAYRQTMQHVRQQLPLRRRVFSQFIHSRVVETASEISAKTIFRPIPLIGAGLVASLVSGVIYIYAKRYGYGVDGSGWFIISFGLGYCLGLVVDLVRLLAIKRSRN